MGRGNAQRQRYFCIPHFRNAMHASITYTIEFIRRADGQAQPDVMGFVVAGSDHEDLDAVIRYAEKLVRPRGAEGLQIRENDGPAIYAMTF